MARKYLENAGIEVDATIDATCATSDERASEWSRQVEECGFAVTELWNLDLTMVCLLYERLSMWTEEDLQYDDETRVNINGVDAKLGHWVDEILSLCQSVFNDNKDHFTGNEITTQKVKKIWLIWSEISPLMWL